jgi:hypothetical protein
MSDQYISSYRLMRYFNFNSLINKQFGILVSFEIIEKNRK